jgi:hypothetical protein
MLKGYKTYLVAVAGLVYAGLGYFLFGMDSTSAIQMVQVSLAAMGLRSAL